MSTIQKSEQLFERAKRVSPGGVHSPVRAFKGVGGTPRFIQKADGCMLTDVDGNPYIDFCMSWGPLIFGHQDPEVAEAVREALSRGWSYGTAEPYSLDLAELITSSLPWVEKIRFVNSGTEAVMATIRLARAATGRTKVLKFDGCYHGHVDSMLVRAGSGLVDLAAPDSAGVSQATSSETLVAPLDDIPALEKIIARHGADLAAILIEPIPANNGLLLPREEFLAELSRVAKKCGALLVFDEVITGFRMAFGGMVERSGVKPDLVCYGKVIGGGFPVGAYGGRSDLMDQIAPSGPVYQAGTLSANPVAMTAGLAMLRKLKRENPYPTLEKNVVALTSRIATAARDAGFTLPFHSQQMASVFWGILGPIQTKDGVVRTIEQIPGGHKATYARLFHALLAEGVYLAPSGFEVSFLSTAHTPAHLDRVVEAFHSAFRKIRDT